ncbi:ornithine cyclodeaminase family protein [Mumia zhuanghuii]|uniref:Ornithine cyclodeaminase family protein n=1 Tax=Mumia zhuanghuii TaxID=2585211 RepID=A0A5C4MQM7_9ACTN|nr:ornithine cyclodeaminase family protein [Mumia zhuanghuii]TNC38212.1 ornithine cyclodeaminase family protein [Mumia zhuanghuii]TNC47860.1 ornithine cyclodeaminase family protein [Mumia zhuanghuii]
MAELLNDTAVLATLRARDAVQWMKEATVAAHRGHLHAPARVRADIGAGSLVVTAGHLDDRWYGYRAYDTFGLVAGEQVVVVHDAELGRVHAMSVGSELGPRRTGAIGGAAADTLATPEASRLGLVGAGTQAWTQLWAIDAVRELEAVRVFTRDPAHAEGFARRAREQLGLDCTVSRSARDAVDGADLVVCATTSENPVIAYDWLAPGTYVATLGPKQQGRHEVDAELLEAADVVVTDSRAQALGYDPPSTIVGTRIEDHLQELGAVLDGAATGRTSHDQTCVFYSVGLAGTEPYLLAKLTGLG